jgi:hypothetical protein
VAANEKEIAPTIRTGGAEKALVVVCSATGSTVAPKQHSRFNRSAT